MKSIYKTLTLSMMAMFLSAGLNAQKSNITKEDLPKSAQTFLKENFINERVVQAEKDNYGNRTDYEIVLSNGTEIEFDNKGNWKEVDAKNKEALPEGFIPRKIVQHITQNFAPHQVSKIEKDRNKYEVELTNGIDLEFSLNGDFLRIDD
ncbi:PepSY-like domain-containing protein [Moheibacter sp.]|uniref:PepSY-like domain-containing protein n=1 Tax=Moheibacter sp. TaxID=1965316 RepID=UPI003C775971